eukprot:CAMPEP_0176047234 /NCGR_PEP_ID=MMETSP0120_2-20121206/23458_1 /TAXON_ID=160619 /ORGANISM="Kryptoperidinium foliaceum, Strain CCMP 1326" /LENGTH=205 /DNA_ID=CAMNT_0017380649 /DNA_START=84 /DNA_END=702 /DNA_ORIENTATION=+
MGKLHTISRGYRSGTRNKFSKKFRTKGMPGVSRYLATFKRGDYVDIVVDSSVQKGMPFSFYHGRTGVVFNVNRNALGVEMTKIVGNRQLRKRIHVNIAHVRKSRCNEDFLRRVKENDRKKQDAKLLGTTATVKRVPEGPKEMKIVKAAPEDVEVLTPLPFIENYFWRRGLSDSEREATVGDAVASTAAPEDVEVLTPLPFIENYF